MIFLQHPDSSPDEPAGLAVDRIRLPFHAGIPRVQFHNNHKNKNLEESPMQKSLPCLLSRPAQLATFA